MRPIPLLTSAAAALLLSGCSLGSLALFGGGKGSTPEQPPVVTQGETVQSVVPDAHPVQQPAPVVADSLRLTPVPVIPTAPAAVPETEVEAPTASTVAPQETPRTADSLLPGRFYVNTGAYAKPVNAQRAERLLREAGLSVSTRIITTRRGVKLTGVRVGPFSTPEQAQAAAATARSLKLETSIFQHRP